eukprot:15331140-Alexandrium_andersonii.AAC.1
MYAGAVEIQDRHYLNRDRAFESLKLELAVLLLPDSGDLDTWEASRRTLMQADAAGDPSVDFGDLK